MRDQMRYINHLGEEIEFGKGNILINENDFRSYKWDYFSANNRISGFEKRIAEKTLPVIVYGEKAREEAQRIHEIIEKDVLLKQKGKMYIGEYYTPGYFVEKKNSGYTRQGSIDISLKFISEYHAWIKELKKEFRPQSAAESTEGLDFPFDFPFDFAPPAIGQAAWKVDHYTSSHFLMTVYGPCVDPIVRINGYPYQIHTVLEAGTYLTIDSRANEVYKYLANGSRESIYNSRAFYPSVFEKIPSGLLQITWPGTFGYDITLFLERSEPRW